MLSRRLLANTRSPYLVLSLCFACGGELSSSGGGGAGGDGAGGIGGDGAGAATSTGGAGAAGAEGGGGADNSAPHIVAMTPEDMATMVATNSNVTATFDEAMAPATLSDQTFVLTSGATTIAGSVSLAGNVATLNPVSNLLTDTEYTATVTVGATDLAGNALAAPATWSFRTGLIEANGPDPVELAGAGDFVILAKSGIDTIPTSAVTGDIGVSPIDATALTGFSLMLDASGTFATSSQLVGNAYAADYVSPTPANLTAAVGSMETAYTDAAGRPTPDFTNLGSGEIGGLTLVPGLYKWGTGVLISTDVTLEGGPDDVWIFQVSGGITEASGVAVTLAGGALPKNIFWQTAGAVALDTGAHFEGVVLSQTEITLASGASVNGRLLSQTAVTLSASVVTEPGL